MSRAEMTNIPYWPNYAPLESGIDLNNRLFGNSNKGVYNGPEAH